MLMVTTTVGLEQTQVSTLASEAWEVTYMVDGVHCNTASLRP
jgi:hypothetical protein